MKLELFDLQKWMNQNGAVENISQLPTYIFNSDISFVFFNDQLDETKKATIYQNLSEFLIRSKLLNEPCFLIPTSGTTSLNLKLVVIEKRKFLNAARRANAFLDSTPMDAWLLSLPVHHVAGLSILARAFLNSAPVYYWTKWQPREFVQKLSQWSISFCSLVPTQIFDLAASELSAPTTLKRVLVGGSALSDSLCQKMQRLSWPLIKTYGMTETSAFISASFNNNDFYNPLPGVTVTLDENQHLALRSDSLFEFYLEQTENGWQKIPKITVDGFWSTEDYAELSSLDKTKFKIIGRQQGMIKIKGELVNLQLLNSRIFEIAIEKQFGSQAFYIHYLPDQRNEHQLIAIVPKNTDTDKLKSVIAHYNKTVLPFERIEWYVLIEEVPKSDLGKVKTGSFNTDEFKKFCLENKKSASGD
jgi:o-succinylbenzoate---CoA ligase